MTVCASVTVMVKMNGDVRVLPTLFAVSAPIMAAVCLGESSPTVTMQWPLTVEPGLSSKVTVYVLLAGSWHTNTPSLVLCGVTEIIPSADVTETVTSKLPDISVLLLLVVSPVYQQKVTEHSATMHKRMDNTEMIIPCTKDLSVTVSFLKSNICFKRVPPFNVGFLRKFTVIKRHK